MAGTAAAAITLRYIGTSAHKETMAMRKVSLAALMIESLVIGAPLR